MAIAAIREVTLLCGVQLGSISTTWITSVRTLAFPPGTTQANGICQVVISLDLLRTRSLECERIGQQLR